MRYPWGMRVPKLPLLLSLALLAFLAPGCTSEVDGAEQAESTPEPASAEDELGLRAIQLLDSATEVIIEATEHKNVETAAVTIKSLAKELGEIETLLNEKKLTMDTHPNLAKQWEAAKGRLASAVSAMTSTDPKVAQTLTGAINGLRLGI